MARLEGLQALDGLRVVVIDSNASVRDALDRRLRDDYRVASVLAVDQTEETIPLVLAYDPHVVLIDPRVPEREPEEFKTPPVLQRPSETPTYVVVIHVSYHIVTEELAAKAAGADLYCLKGLKISVLVDLMGEAVRRRLPATRWPTAIRLEQESRQPHRR